MRRSMPPVARRLVSSDERLLDSGTICLPNVLRAWVIGLAATSALRPGTNALPRVVIAGVDDFANGPSEMIQRLIAGAWAPRSVSTGVISSDRAPRRTIVGLSWRRNAGRSAQILRN